MLSLILLAISAATADSSALSRLDTAASCIIRKNLSGAARIAGSQPYSDQEAVLLQTLSKVVARCASGQDIHPVIDAVARRLFNKYFPTITLYRHDVADMAPEANGVLEHADGLPVQSLALKCVASLRPDQSDAYVQAQLGSDQEQSALAVLTPLLSRCVRDGQSLSWKSLDLKLGLARWLYIRYDVRGIIL